MTNSRKVHTEPMASTDIQKPKRVRPEKYLTAEQRIKIIHQIAIFKNDEQITSWAKKNFGMTVTPEAVEQYRYSKKYSPIIKKLREEFNLKLFEVEFAYKRRRIEELESIYHESRSTEDRKNAIRSLQAIQDEVEGKQGQNKGAINIYQYNQYNQMTDEEIDQRRLELINQVMRYKTRKEIAAEVESGDVKDAETV